MMNKELIENACAEICDRYCKYPLFCVDEDALHGLCDECPLNKLLDEKPRPVNYSGDGYSDGHLVYDMAECPNCGHAYEESDETWESPYCPECGQLLDWTMQESEEEQ
jgi:hypothetical protein